MILQRVLLITAVLALGACAEISGLISPPEPEPVVVEEKDVFGQTLPAKARQQGVYSAPAASTASKPAKPAEKVDEVVAAPPAVKSLLEKAVAQRQAGDNDAAAATVERAIHIAPRYPASYYLLGDIRLEQGQVGQARSLASKALALGAQGDLKQQAEQLIARCDSMGQ